MGEDDRCNRAYSSNQSGCTLMAKKAAKLKTDNVMEGEQPSITNRLPDMMEIIATGKSPHMKAGEVYSVSGILAQTLINK